MNSYQLKKTDFSVHSRFEKCFSGDSAYLFGIRDRGYSTQDIVIADGDIQYLVPAIQSVTVVASWRGEVEKSDFFFAIEKKCNGRINTKANIFVER